MEIVFSITQEADGGFVGECLSHDIFTQGESWEQLRANVIRKGVTSFSKPAIPGSTESPFPIMLHSASER